MRPGIIIIAGVWRCEYGYIRMLTLRVFASTFRVKDSNFVINQLELITCRLHDSGDTANYARLGLAALMLVESGLNCFKAVDCGLGFSGRCTARL